MKKCWFALLLCLTLVGCSGPAFETMSDHYEVPEDLTARQVALMLPQEALLLSEKGNDAEQFYLCKDFTVAVQTFSSGDLSRTLQLVTGYDRDRVGVLELQDGDWKRYECVWVSAGESGDRLCRAVILDDGEFHYVLTLEALAENALQVRESWQEIVGSFSLDTAP